MICVQLDVTVSLTWAPMTFGSLCQPAPVQTVPGSASTGGRKHVHSMRVSKFLNNLQNIYRDGENAGVVYSTSVFPGFKQEWSLEEMFGGFFMCMIKVLQVLPG